MSKRKKSREDMPADEVRLTITLNFVGKLEALDAFETLPEHVFAIIHATSFDKTDGFTLRYVDGKYHVERGLKPVTL